jgi:hypothetical protein
MWYYQGCLFDNIKEDNFMKRTEKIEIRLTKLEKEKFIEIQRKLGYSSLSEMIRHLLFDVSKEVFILD